MATSKTETKKITETPSDPGYKVVVNRPYDVDVGQSLLSEIRTTEADENAVVVKIQFGNDFTSSGNHTPDNKVAPYAVEGYVDEVKIAIKE